MPAPELEGQFDGVPIDKPPEDFRQQHNYIDDTPPEHSDDISEDDDDFDSDELDDNFARVEDERAGKSQKGVGTRIRSDAAKFLKNPSSPS